MKKRKPRQNIWDDVRTRIAQDLAYEGFYHRTIARAAGLTRHQVTYRLNKIGITTNGVRGGLGQEARERIDRIVGKYRKARAA